MRILVTGAAGLIGSGVAARLAREHDVIRLDLKAGPLVSLVADCFDVTEWRHRVGRMDAIVHVAALHAPHVGTHSDDDSRRSNIKATSRLVDYALEAEASHFVLTSTTSLYGHALESKGAAVWVDEQLEPQPRDIYDETKLEAERIVAQAGRAMTVTSLRMSRCFPEPEEEMAWYRLYRGVDRRDVVEAHALALLRDGPPATFVVSSATPFHREDVEELARDAAAVIERRCPGLLDRMRNWKPLSSIDRVYDSSLAMTELGYMPRFGIREFLDGDRDPGPKA